PLVVSRFAVIARIITRQDEMSDNYVIASSACRGVCGAKAVVGTANRAADCLSGAAKRVIHRCIEKLTRDESVPRAVASEDLSIGLLIELRSLPLAVLTRGHAVLVNFSMQRSITRVYFSLLKSQLITLYHYLN